MGDIWKVFLHNPRDRSDSPRSSDSQSDHESPTHTVVMADSSNTNSGSDLKKLLNTLVMGQIQLREDML